MFTYTTTLPPLVPPHEYTGTSLNPFYLLDDLDLEVLEAFVFLAVLAGFFVDTFFLGVVLFFVLDAATFFFGGGAFFFGVAFFFLGASLLGSVVFFVLVFVFLGVSLFLGAALFLLGVVVLLDCGVVFFLVVVAIAFFLGAAFFFLGSTFVLGAAFLASGESLYDAFTWMRTPVSNPRFKAFLMTCFLIVCYRSPTNKRGERV